MRWLTRARLWLHWRRHPSLRKGEPVIHELKTHPEPFELVHCGLKGAEFRLNDRDYETGDHLRLREYEPEAGRYTGREVYALVTCVTVGYGIPAGYAMLSLRVLERRCVEPTWARAA